MAVVSLALFKKHVRADDFADDDELRAFADDAGIEAGSYLDEEDDWFGW